jgi:Tfp pilus assembly protein PilO
MSSSNRLIVSILAIAAIAIAFWMLALGPKREEADKLSSQVGQMQSSLVEAQAKVTEAVAAKREFPTDYQQLVLLGSASPASEETASLLVELNHIASKSKVKFESISLNSEGTGEAAAVPAPAPAPEASSAPNGVPAAATVPPTEAAASLTPLGASIGPAGLAVMPYSLTFSGSFFHVADFIKGIDALVGTGEDEVAVDGRLVTVDGFALNAAAEGGFPRLNATFAVTTYVTPPSQGLTAGATPSAPAPSVATPAAASTTAESAASTTSESEPAQ